MQFLQNRRRPLTWASFCVLLASCVFVLLTRFTLKSDLWAFLPTLGDSPSQRFTRGLLSGELARSLVLAVAPDPRHCPSDARCDGAADQARAAAHRLSRALEHHAAVAQVSSGPAPSFEPAVHELYFPRRFALPASSTKEPYSKEYVAERVAALKEFLASPKAALYRSQLVADPMLFFPNQVERLAELKPAGVEVVDGQFVTKEGLALVFCATQPNLTGEQKTELHDFIHAEFRRQTAGSRNLRLLMSGSLPFEVHGEAKSKQDMQRVGVISTLMAVALTLLLFRSISALLAVLLPVALAYLVGMVATLVVFGEIHVLTLAFGASLIGVSIDYPSHLLNEAALRQSTLRKAAHHARPGLLVGCLSTVAGFFAFGLSSASALLQVGVFAISGLLAALLATLYLLPELPISYGPGVLQRRLAAQLATTLPVLQRHSTWISVGMGGLLVVSAASLTFANYEVHPRALDPSPAALKADDSYVRARLGLSEDMLVVSDSELEEAILASNKLAASLEQRKESGAILSYRSVNALYQPLALQSENLRRAASPTTGQLLRTELDRAGFEVSAFAETPLGTSAVRSPLLSFAELLASPLGDLARPFVIQSANMVSVVTQVSASPQQMQTLLRDHPEVMHYEPELLLTQSFTRLAQDMKWALLSAVGLVLLLVMLRHRHIRPTLAAFLPAALGAFVTLWIISMHEPLHMFHLLSAISVLSMGVDYGTFMVETQKREGRPDAWPSVLSAALSTLISFGCLGLSDVPALRAIGWVIGLGTLVSIVATPLSYTLLTSRPEPHRTSP